MLRQTILFAVLLFSEKSPTVRAEEYTFGDWTVTVEAKVSRPVAARPQSGIRLVSQASSLQDLPMIVPDQPSAIGLTDLPVEAGDTSATGGTAAACPQGSPAELARLYRQVYNAIPFSRAEYDASPSYRHDATMEFLFGQMRPTVIQRGTTKVDVNLPSVDFVPPPYNRYGMNSFFYPFYTGRTRVYRGW
jgi:hypothetical protein